MRTYVMALMGATMLVATAANAAPVENGLQGGSYNAGNGGFNVGGQGGGGSDQLQCCGGQEWGGGGNPPRSGYSGGVGGGLRPDERGDGGGGNGQNGTGRNGAGSDGGI